MANAFRCGTKPIPAGVTELDITGIQLDFDPNNILPIVRQPMADSPLISAYVVGDITKDGFSVAFNAPIPSEGYTLEYTAFLDDGEHPSVDGDTLAYNYTDLVRIVSRYLGYNHENLTSKQSAEVDDIVQSGIRNFYYPPAMQGVDVDYEWSFIRQDGSILTEANTDSYRMPDGFGRIAGQIVVSGEVGKSIPIIPIGDIMRMRNSSECGRPRFAAVASENNFGGKGQTKRLYLYPCPDREYTLAFRCDADTGKIDAVNHPYPLGGAMYAELIKESCLSSAEQSSNDEVGLHTSNFNTLLVSMIQRDRKSGAQNYGMMSEEKMW